MTPLPGLPLLPVYLVGFFGAITMIVFAGASFYYARRLVRLQPKNVLWTYLFWLSISLTALALSRGIGHLVRYVFIFFDKPEVWIFLSPYSGGLNSIAFCCVAVLTFYYHNIGTATEKLRNYSTSLEKANRDLQQAHNALHSLNMTLEERVEKRTSDLRMSEEQFRGLFEGSKDMIYFCDKNGNICDINNSGLELLGVACKEDIVGRPLADFFVEQESWQQYSEMIKGQGHIKDFEVEMVGAGGSKLSLMITASAIQAATGRETECDGCEGIAHDLTHFKEMTEKLVQSEKMTSVGQLAAGVAHEINTPLGIILGYTQLMEEELVAQPGVVDTLKIIEKQTKICRRIVADLLRFSRNAAEQKFAVANLNKCLNEAMSITEHSLNMDHIYIYQCLDEDLPNISFDYGRMLQVFINLLTNARHAIGREGIIGVWSRYVAESDEAEVVIADTGSGIDPALQGRIFDPFFTTKSVGMGTGLGLSVSYGIITDHNGRIEVESPPHDNDIAAAGLQTAFHIFLPVSMKKIEP